VNPSASAWLVSPISWLASSASERPSRMVKPSAWGPCAAYMASISGEIVCQSLLDGPPKSPKALRFCIMARLMPGVST
jgi:hypothetical protein